MPLHPRSDQILLSILASFEEFVVPELEDPFAVSVGHTIRNLLRHLALRIELEPPALYELNEELREVLADVAAYARGSSAAALAGLAGELDEALAAVRPATAYPSPSTLTAHAVVLREALDRALKALQAARPEAGDDPAYRGLRERIRAWIAHALEREAAWITPAFEGIRR